MTCSTDSRTNHYDCSTGFSSSEQVKVSLHINAVDKCEKETSRMRDSQKAEKDTEIINYERL